MKIKIFLHVVHNVHHLGIILRNALCVRNALKKCIVEKAVRKCTVLLTDSVFVEKCNHKTCKFVKKSSNL